MVQLSEELLLELDGLASARGTSRSALIRDLLDTALAGQRGASIDAQIIAGYERHPQIEPDAWGSATDTADVAVTELLQRLDAEERAAGHEPW